MGRGHVVRDDPLKTGATPPGNTINAQTTFGNYPMIGTPEDTLLRYPDNFQDLQEVGVGDMRFDQMTPAR